MSIGALVLRAGVSPDGDIAHLVTRGLDIGAAIIPVVPPLVVSSRHSLVYPVMRASATPTGVRRIVKVPVV